MISSVFSLNRVALSHERGRLLQFSHSEVLIRRVHFFKHSIAQAGRGGGGCWRSLHVNREQCCWGGIVFANTSTYRLLKHLRTFPEKNTKTMTSVSSIIATSVRSVFSGDAVCHLARRRSLAEKRGDDKDLLTTASGLSWSLKLPELAIFENPVGITRWEEQPLW